MESSLKNLAAGFKGACSRLNIQQAPAQIWKGDVISLNLLIR